MNKILAFDTSTEACSAALKVGDTVIQRFEVSPRQHAELILSMIDSLLAEMQYKLSELSAIAFGQGPGSFMGVRIAASVAQGLGYAVQIPLIPVSTLQALAQQAYMSYHYEQVITAWDARMHEIYWAIYCRKEGSKTMHAVIQDSLTAPRELLNAQFQPKFREYSYGLVGNAFNIYQSELKEMFVQAAGVNGELYPTAKAITYIAEEFFQQNKVVTAIEAQPLYLRNNVAKQPKLGG